MRWGFLVWEVERGGGGGNGAFLDRSRKGAVGLVVRELSMETARVGPVDEASNTRGLQHSPLRASCGPILIVS